MDVQSTKEGQEAVVAETGEIMEFTLRLAEKTFRIDGEEYMLRELDGEGRGKYLDGISSRLAFSAETGKVTGMKSFTGLEASLLSLCLYGPDDVLVSTKKLANWPSTVLTKLFEQALELSGLSDLAAKKMQEKAKNA